MKLTLSVGKFVLGCLLLGLTGCYAGGTQESGPPMANNDLWSQIEQVQGLSADPIDSLGEAKARAEVVVVGVPVGIRQGRTYELGPGAGAPEWSDESVRTVIVELQDATGRSYPTELTMEPGTAVDEVDLPKIDTASFIKRAYVDAQGRQIWACLEPGWCGIAPAKDGYLMSLTSDDVTEVLRGTSSTLRQLAKSPTGS